MSGQTLSHAEWQGEIEEIADSLVGEIKNRLRDRPGDIPDHVLSKMLSDVNRLIERRREDETIVDHGSVLDQVDALPPDRAKEVVAREASRLFDLYDRHFQVLIRLAGSPEAAGKLIQEA